MNGMRNRAFDPASMKAAAEDYSSSDSDGDDNDDFLAPSTDPRQDEFADLHRRKRRRTDRGGNAKERAALGVFGSDSEDDGPGRQWKRTKTLRNKGVSFVSSAAPASRNGEIGRDDQDDDEDEDDEHSGADYDQRPSMSMRASIDQDEDDEDEDDEDEEAGGVGLGFGASSGQGLGWAPPTAAKSATRTASTPVKARTKFDGSTPLGRGFVPTSTAEPVLRVRDDEPSHTPTVARPSAFSGRAKGAKGSLNPSSFGARMMAKMGYVQGKGLGKEGQGRNVIIEASLRPQGAGLGAVKEKSEQERKEEKRQARMRGEVVLDSDEEEKKRKAERRRKKALGSGATSGASTPRRQKPRYMTMEEVKKAAPGLHIPDAFTPILDLTGPGKKMLTSSTGIMTPSGAVERTEDVESRKLARRAQNDFMAILEEWKSLQERKAYVELQLQQEEQELDDLTQRMEGELSISTALGGLSGQVQETQWEARWQMVMSLLKTVGGIAASGEMGDIAVAAIQPLFKEALQTSWEPLTNPTFLAKELAEIRPLLMEPSSTRQRRKQIASAYECMMYKMWLPAISRSVRSWDAHDPDPMLAFFEAWDGLLPRFIRSHFLEQDIVRKLDEAVSRWEPRRKRHHNLPHMWLFPWLQHLPAHHLDPKASTGLVSDVKRKYRQLIDVWEFDRGVIPGLKKWKAILRPRKDKDQWKPLVMNHVLPSMARYLRKNFRVDPSNQEPYLEMLTGVFKWLDVLAPSLVGEVMVSDLFPMWHDVLYQWLVTDDASFDEIGAWFDWWQNEVLPDELKVLPSVEAEFEKGTEMINQALDLGDRAKAELKAPSRGPALPTKSSPPPTVPQPPSTPLAPQPKEVTFRDIVEGWCQDNDLQFIPERKKVHAEGPLFRITARGDGRGGVLTYFKGDALFAEKKNETKEIRADREGDMETLLMLAE